MTSNMSKNLVVKQAGYFKIHQVGYFSNIEQIINWLF